MPLFPWLISSYPGLGAIIDCSMTPGANNYPKSCPANMLGPSTGGGWGGGVSSRNYTCLEQGSEESLGEAAEVGGVEQGGEQALHCTACAGEKNSACLLPPHHCRTLQSLV